MPATRSGLSPLMALVSCFRHAQVVCRSAVVAAAELRLLTPLQQPPVGADTLPVAYMMHGASMLTTSPHVTALTRTAGATTSSATTITAATLLFAARAIGHKKTNMLQSTVATDLHSQMLDIIPSLRFCVNI
uniref:Uncharacterized protein n=1 Tax=Oryza punctata TaxID=4537 RepID=A0A0E0MBQ0_ORYPU